MPKPQRLNENCASCEGSGQRWPATGALGAADLGMACALLEEVAINPTIDAPELTELVEQMLRRHKQNLVCTRTQEKGQVTPQETDPTCP